MSNVEIVGFYCSVPSVWKKRMAGWYARDGMVVRRSTEVVSDSMNSDSDQSDVSSVAILSKFAGLKFFWR